MLIEREVTVHANKKSGMTASELMRALDGVPSGMVPTVVINIKGRVKAIKVKVQIATI